MRIGTGGLAHETNVFCNLPVTAKQLASIKQIGDTFFACNTGVRNGPGGYIDEANRLGIDLVPTIYCFPGPSGPTEQAAFEAYRDELVERLWQAHCEKPLDGIALALHGAGAADGYDDLEGEILRAVRQRFGMEIPIAMELDLHANMSTQMVELCDIIVGYKCYPHTDFYECGVTTMKLLHDAIQSGKKPHCALIQLPWLLASAFGSTLEGAGHKVQQFMKQLVDSHDDLLDATFFHGFFYADVPFAGASVVAMAKTEEAANRYAKQVAAYAWSLREEFTKPTNSAAQAMDLAEQATLPALIHESSDNPGGGTPGDGTHLLREMLKRNIPGSVFAQISDPEVVHQAIEAGIGSHIRCSLGAKRDDLHGTPIELEDAYVKTISDGVYIQKNPMSFGARISMGRAVLLQVGNVFIVVSEGRLQNMDDGPFRINGIAWNEMRILGVKSTHHFKGWWKDQACTIIPCDSPGIHSADLSSFDFKKVSTDKFPLCDAAWE